LFAHDLCGGLRQYRRTHYVEPGAGRYGVFSSRHRNNHIYPVVREAIHAATQDGKGYRKANMLKGKTALVTGSTSGIGLGIAEALAAQGANIIINGFGAGDAIDALRQRLSAQHGVEVRYDAADMSKPETIEAMINRAIAEFGAIDVLVNNAGIQHVAPIEEFPVEKWNAIIAINLVASFHTMRLVIPAMKQRRWGRIINIASAHALVASPFKSAYVAAKHGLAGLTKTAALETAACGITVNAICPGYVLTPLVEKQIPDTARTRGITEEQVVNTVLLAAQPTKQFVTIEQVASLAMYLANDAAASVTGALLSIDGGWTAQ
jgi:3-hydroxybutyrate dehydrogenase